MGIPKTTIWGLLAIVLGLSVIIIQPSQIINRWALTFSENSPSFSIWMKPDWFVYMKVYLFNITNLDDFLHKNKKLKLQEVGPIIYRERAEHRNPVFNQENGTVTAHPIFYLEKIAETNESLLETTLMLPHVALLLFADLISSENFIIKGSMNLFFEQTNSEPVVPQTVREFMFGYQSPLLTVGNTLMSRWISFSKLGILDRTYDFEGDVSTTFSGETNGDLLGILDTYNHLPYVPHWEAPCNRLQFASVGLKFPNNIKENQTLMVWRKSICRTLPMVQCGPPRTTSWGIPTVRYKFKEDALDNGHGNPENKCFCRKGKCLPSGLIDSTDCFYGFSTAVSYPHFYSANDSLLDGVDGLNPDKNMHESFFDINPQMGTVTKCSVKVQMNAVLGDLSDFSCCKQFSNMILPLIWIDLEVPDMPWNISLQLFLLIHVLPVTDMVISCFSVVLGILLIIHSLYVHNTTTHSLIVDEQEANSSNTKKFKRLPIETTNSQHVSQSNVFGNATDNSCLQVLLMTNNNNS